MVSELQGLRFYSQFNARSGSEKRTAGPLRRKIVKFGGIRIKIQRRLARVA